MAPSTRCPLNRTGVRRIHGWKTQKALKIATWNVRSLKSPEKIHNLCKEMKRMAIDVMGLSDVRWKDSGTQRIDNDYTLYYSGSRESSNKHSVGVMINTKTVDTSVSFVPKSNRTMLLQIQAKPKNINILQGYAPTSDASDKEIQSFYEGVEKLQCHN